MATPAGAIKGLRTGDDVIDRIRVAADAFGLDNFVGLPGGANGSRVGFKGEGKYVLHSGITLVEIVADYVLVGKMTISTDTVSHMGGVVPILILVVHDVAIVAGGWFMGKISRRVCHPSEDAQCDQQDKHPKNKRSSVVHQPIPKEKRNPPSPHPTVRMNPFYWYKIGSMRRFSSPTASLMIAARSAHK
jgi:hypothetical protein